MSISRHPVIADDKPQSRIPHEYTRHLQLTPSWIPPVEITPNHATNYLTGTNGDLARGIIDARGIGTGGADGAPEASERLRTELQSVMSSGASIAKARALGVIGDRTLAQRSASLRQVACLAPDTAVPDEGVITAPKVF